MKTHLLRFSALALAAAFALVGTSHPLEAAPPPLLPVTGIAFQPAELDPTADTGSAFAFAPTFGSAHVTRVAFIPYDPLKADDGNYRALWIEEVDTKGNFVGSPLFFTTTQVSLGTGDWTAGRPAFSATLDYDLPAGHALMGAWRPVGEGVELPAGAWRVE